KINAKMKYSDPPLDFWWNASSSRGLVRLLVLWGEKLKCVMPNESNEGSIYKYRMCYGITVMNTLPRDNADVVSHVPDLIEVMA
ncbi:hypothetical protein Tco_0188299, partial [Tanacetum coccineum]